MIITCKWNPYCNYQFSIDRINNNLPHDRNNSKKKIIKYFFLELLS